MIRGTPTVSAGQIVVWVAFVLFHTLQLGVLSMLRLYAEWLVFSCRDDFNWMCESKSVYSRKGT